MHASYIMTDSVGGFDFDDNLIQGQRCCINNPCFRLGLYQNGFRYQRTSVENDAGLADQVEATNGDQVGRAGSGADEVYGHEIPRQWVITSRRMLRVKPVDPPINIMSLPAMIRPLPFCVGGSRLKRSSGRLPFYRADGRALDWCLPLCSFFLQPLSFLRRRLSSLSLPPSRAAKLARVAASMAWRLVSVVVSVSVGAEAPAQPKKFSMIAFSAASNRICPTVLIAVEPPMMLLGGGGC